MGARFDYKAVLADSERNNWRVEDIIGGAKRLDFNRPFLPESLARTGAIEALAPAQRQALNHVRGHGYLYTFGLVEEFILPFVLDHARPHLHGDDYRVRALLRFAAEEAKHIHLFKVFRQEFQRDFGTPCEVIGPPREIARSVLAHHPLAVALTILHIEWMTQRHYVESVKDETGLDPQFCSLLRHHWMEEAQHAKLDTLMVEALADACTPDEIDRAIDEYLEIGGLLDGGLGQQVELDLDSLERATGTTLADDVKSATREAQRGAIRWTFLGSGMTHPRFLDTVAELRPGARARIEEVAVAFQ